MGLSETGEKIRAAFALHAEVLSTRERLVIQQRFEDGMTLQQISQALDLTRDRVRHIEAEAVSKLRSVVSA